MAKLGGVVAAALLTVGACLGATAAEAATPMTIGIEGRLQGQGGGPVVDGVYTLTFGLYGEEKGATAAWSESAKVAVTAGHFVHALGSVKALSAADVDAGKAAWVGVAVDQEPELPRAPLRAVAFAVRAAVADSAVSAETAKVAETAQKVGCNGCVAAGALAFPYAASSTKGGPALDLACTACVGVEELKFDGDVDFGGHGLKAGSATFSGDLVAKTVTAVGFVGDGSKLTGIALPKGSCAPGEAIVAIKQDGTVTCAATSAQLPADGLNEVSNGLLTNEFMEVASIGAAVAIPDNTGAAATITLDVPSWGVAKSVKVSVKVSNTDLSTLTLKLMPPDDGKVGFVLCSPCGNKDEKALDGVWTEKTVATASALGKWVGKDVVGKWTLVATDSSFCVKQAPGNASICDFDQKTDGAVLAYSIEAATVSSKKVGALGNVHVSGELTAVDFRLPIRAYGAKPCDAAQKGTVFYDSALSAVVLCDGLKFRILETAVLDPGSKYVPAYSCLELKKKWSKPSGLYWIDPDGLQGPLKAVEVFCDQDTDGGGWTRIDYSEDLEFKVWYGTGGDQFRWVPENFKTVLSAPHIMAIQASSTEGKQVYQGLCNDVLLYVQNDGGAYKYAVGFMFHDGSTTPFGQKSYAPFDISVPIDGCADNAGEGGNPAKATYFHVKSKKVPIINVYTFDNGDSTEAFGSQLTKHPAWLR